MKNLSIKKFLVGLFALLALTFTALGVTMFSPATQSVSAAIPSPAPTTFQMENGASIRTSSTNAVRFSTYFNKSWVDEQMQTQEVEIGTLIAPEFFLTDSTDANFNAQTPNVNKYVHTQDKWFEETAGYYKVNAVLDNIPDSELATDLVAKAYIKIGSDYTYAEATNVQTRSIGEVSAKAIAAGATDTVTSTILSKVITFTDKETEEKKLYAGESTSLGLYTIAEGLREQPDLAKYGIEISYDENKDILTYDAGNVTAKTFDTYTGKKTTVSLTFAGATKSVTVKPMLRDNLNAYYGGDLNTKEYIFTATYGEVIVEPAQDVDMAKQGSLVDEVTFTKAEGGQNRCLGGGLSFSCGVLDSQALVQSLSQDSNHRASGCRLGTALGGKRADFGRQQSPSHGVALYHL